MEALACGCVPELILEGRTGFSFPPGDAEQLAIQMRRLPDLGDCATVVDACHTVIQQFTPEYAAAQILSGCRQILRDQGSPS